MTIHVGPVSNACKWHSHHLKIQETEEITSAIDLWRSHQGLRTLLDYTVVKIWQRCHEEFGALEGAARWNKIRDRSYTEFRFPMPRTLLQHIMGCLSSYRAGMHVSSCFTFVVLFLGVVFEFEFRTISRSSVRTPICCCKSCTRRTKLQVSLDKNRTTRSKLDMKKIKHQDEHDPRRQNPYCKAVISRWKETKCKANTSLWRIWRNFGDYREEHVIKNKMLHPQKRILQNIKRTFLNNFNPTKIKSSPCRKPLTSTMKIYTVKLHMVKDE